MKTTTTTERWRVCGVYDVLRQGPEMYQCDKCNTWLRYVHIIESDDGVRLQVGGCCARKLCHGYNPKEREREAKRFVNPQTWKTSQKGNPYRFVIINGETLSPLFSRRGVDLR